MIKYNADYPDVFTFPELPWVVVGMVCVAAVILLLSRLKGRAGGRLPAAVMASGFVIANVVAGYLVMTTATVPVSDYKAIWETALRMAAGDFDISELPYYDYMSVYNWQLGISWVESLSVRLFGPTIVPLQIFNIVLLNVALALTYLLAKRYIADRLWRSTVIFLLATFYPVVVTMPQFTNQHMACVLILSVINLLTARVRWQYWLTAGCLIALLNMVRPMGIILLITAVCYVVALLAGGKETWRRVVTAAAALAVAYAVVMSVINVGFERAGYADGPISEAKIPYFKFDKGLTGYNSPDVAAYESVEQFNEWERDRVKDAVMVNSGSTLAYVLTKMVRYLGCFDYKVEMTYNQDDTIWNTGAIKRWVMIGWGQYIAILVLALLSLPGCRKMDFAQPMFIFYVGITLVYIFIEAFTSYRYESYPYLFIIACMGAPTLFARKRSTGDWVARSHQASVKA